MYSSSSFYEKVVFLFNFKGSTGTRDSGLMRKPLIKHSGHEVTVRTRSAGKREWHVSASPKRNRKNLAVGSGKVYDGEFCGVFVDECC